MPNPSELERQEQEAQVPSDSAWQPRDEGDVLDPRIDPSEPVVITMRRGSLQSQLMIDPLLFDVCTDRVKLIAAPVAAFVKEMFGGR